MPYQKTKEGRLVNEVTLGDGYPLSNDLQPLKVGGEASPIEVSTSLPDNSDNAKVVIKGDLEVTGTTKGIDTDTNTTYTVSCVDGDNSDEEKIRLTGSDSSTDDVVLEAGTGLSIARDGDKITFTNTVTDTDTVLTTEQVQDIVGAMVSGNTETNIAVTYEDADGTLDFVATGDVTLAGNQTFTGQKNFNTSFPQVQFTDDSHTDKVQVGLSGDDFIHKASDANIDFHWQDGSGNNLMSLDTAEQTLTLGEGTQSTYTLKIGDNGRMNSPVRGFEMEDSHGYFSPIGGFGLPYLLHATNQDLIRHQTPLTLERWNGSAYVDAISGTTSENSPQSNLTGLKNILDGERDTQWQLDDEWKKFRFVIERESTWADDQLIYLELTWSSITYSNGSAAGGSMAPTMTVEMLDGSFDASDDSNNDWTTHTPVTTDWHTTGISDQYGLLMYYKSSGMHSNDTHVRITVEFPDWDASAGGNDRMPIKNIGILSTYASSKNTGPWTTDWDRNADGYGDVNIPTGHSYKINASSVLSGTTLGSNVVNSSLTSVGTISSGTWNGTAIASAYLDSDTAHLSGSQTFSGKKTFNANLAVNGQIDMQTSENVLITSSSDQNLALNVDGEDKIVISDESIKFETNSNLLKERSAAGSDVAGYGQIWVKNDTPNNLYFTNDAGNDVQITNGSSLASSSTEFRQLINAGFNYSYTAGTKIYIPLVGYILERNSQFGANEYLSYVAPYSGYLNQVVFRSEEACGSTVVGFHKSSTGTEHPNATASDSVTVDMSADDTSYKFAFTGGMSGTAHQFSAGDIINISFDPTNDANDVVFTAEFILDSSSGL